jgi:hypothetical protein
LLYWYKSAVVVAVEKSRKVIQGRGKQKPKTERQDPSP